MTERIRITKPEVEPMAVVFFMQGRERGMLGSRFLFSETKDLFVKRSACTVVEYGEPADLRQAGEQLRALNIIEGLSRECGRNVVLIELSIKRLNDGVDMRIIGGDLCGDAHFRSSLDATPIALDLQYSVSEELQDSSKKKFDQLALTKVLRAGLVINQALIKNRSKSLSEKHLRGFANITDSQLPTYWLTPLFSSVSKSLSP